MDDKSYKRLVRLLIISWVLIVILIFLLASLSSYQISQVRSVIASSKPQVITVPESEPPIPAKDGYTPIKNVDYFDGQNGQDGQNASDEQVDRAVEKYFAAHPVKDGQDGKDGKDGATGDTGATGLPGRIIWISEDGLQCRYNGDSRWQPIGECG